jgi:hypothetical protein
MNSIDKIDLLIRESNRINLNDEDKIQSWSAEALIHLDKVLGPSKINLHSPAYYDFANGSFTEKIAILKATIELNESLARKPLSNKIFSGLLVTVIGGVIVLLIGKLIV